MASEVKHTAGKPQAVERGIECIGYALAAYAKERGTRLADKTDLLTDLLHFADQGGEDCEQLVRDALHNWKAER